MNPNNENRLNPDLLLQQLKQQETSRNRKKGYLKIFLGYIAGVGKTYRMLSEAHSLHDKGEDVVVGIVETHGRQETMELLHGLEVIPRLNIDYKGIQVDEFNLDLVLQRKPKYVLVDELAHTNIPGSRHTKRYQDVEEIINAGISVYTTLNIQHIESVKDVVRQITEVDIKETVPDYILEMADKIELVDLPIEELLQRLAEGKVYIPDKAKLASQNFFQEGHLLALREMALRYTMRHVDEAMMIYMQLQGIKGPWAVGSRILVCLSPSPSAEQPLRVAQRLASDLNAEWFAVYVDSPSQKPLNSNSQRQLDNNLRLAEQLGAKIVRLSSSKPADEIVSFARSKNVNLIVIGFSQRSRWQRWWYGSFLNEVIDKSSPIQVLVVGDQEIVQTKPTNKIKESFFKFDYPSIYMSLLLVIVTTIICHFLRAYINLTNIALIFIIPIIFSSLRYGLVGGILASITGVLCFNFFFVPPIWTFGVYDVQFLPTFLVILGVGVVTSILADIIRRQNEKSKARERFISLLYEFSRDLLYSIGMVDLLDRITTDISNLFQCDVILYLPDGQGRLHVKSREGNTVELHENENTIAAWVYEHEKPAGRLTDTLSSSNWYFVPLNVKNDIVGVMALGRAKDIPFLSREQEYWLESFVSIISLSIKNYSDNLKSDNPIN